MKDIREEEILPLLKIVVDHNETQMNKADGDQNNAKNLIDFVDEKSGQVIYNPFYDPSFRFDVNPIEEYGREHILSMITRYYEKNGR